MTDHALVIVDMQNNYFPGGCWLLVDVEDTAENSARLLAFFRKNALPIIHIRHEFKSADAPFFAPGSPGAQINASV